MEEHPSFYGIKIVITDVIWLEDSQGRLQEFGLWYAHMMPKSGGGGGADYNLTVIIQSTQWIYNIYILFIIYITLFIISITLLMIGVLIYTYISIIYIDIFIVIR